MPNHVGLGVPGVRANGNGLKSRAMAGLVLLDPNLKPIYANSEALLILSYPSKRAPSNLLSNFAKKLSPLLAPQLFGRNSPLLTEVVSGRRRYHCKAFLLEHNPEDESRPSIAVTIERNGQRCDIFAALAEQFHLTARESEAIALLAEGLTSKEIASRMKISPNTVKTFLRLVMIKMNVTTRSGVVGKIIEAGRWEPGRRKQTANPF